MTELLRELSDYSHLTKFTICQMRLDKECASYIADIANGNP